MRKEKMIMGNPKGKTKFLLWLNPDAKAMVENNYRADDCRSQSEYIEKAIRFYTGHVIGQDNRSYLPNAIVSLIKAVSNESDNRMSRMLFKLAVEQAIMMNLLASQYEIDPVTLAQLRGSCVEEVKKINGGLSMEDAVDWQRG